MSKNAFWLLGILYLVLWAVCVGVAVFDGGIAVGFAAVAVAQILAIPAGISLCAMLAVFFLD
jgi:hypothetical protein